jgi:hypothetical protein
MHTNQRTNEVRRIEHDLHQRDIAGFADLEWERSVSRHARRSERRSQHHIKELLDEFFSQ